MSYVALEKYRLQSFKAVQDSGELELTPLTVLIGDNGSGKSSLLEGLETFQVIVTQDLDRALQPWRGFEYLWNQAVKHDLQLPNPNNAAARHWHTHPMQFALSGYIQRQSYAVDMQINTGADMLFIQTEQVKLSEKLQYRRNAQGKCEDKTGEGHTSFRLADGESVVGGIPQLRGFVQDWQFLALNPQAMGQPVPRRRASGQIQLAKDGMNIAEYLLDIRRLDQAAFEGILETLQYILPYAGDLQPKVTSEVERTVYLQLTETHFKVPGWLLSTGTLRLLALLALFRHPTPPPLIVIEEIENGLDPRTINLIVEEIRTLVESGRAQVILTTHSPYLLDLLHLSHIVLVERVDGQPTFTRPADQEALQEWARRFNPGQLYTMQRLSRGTQA